MSKSPDAFRTISEVAEWLDTPAHVLRFWESRFTQVKPIKRAGGRRYYRPADMALLGGIKKLLHEDGMTIKGVQKVLREKGVKHVAGLSDPVGIEDEAADEEIAEAPMIEIDAEEPAETVVPFPGGAPRALAAEPAPEAASDDGWPEAEADSPAEAAEDFPADPEDASAAAAEPAAEAQARAANPLDWPSATTGLPPIPHSRDELVWHERDIRTQLQKALGTQPAAPAAPAPAPSGLAPLIPAVPVPPDQPTASYAAIPGVVALLSRIDRLSPEQAAELSALASRLRGGR